MRMSALAAALIRPQLSVLPERVARWRAIHADLVERLSGVPHLSVPARPPEEGFVPSSLQFSLNGLDMNQMRTFVSECQAHGVHLKWFGEDEPVGFTSRPDHWRYLKEPWPTPNADRVLKGLCDFRLPLSLSEADCRTVAAVIKESMQATLGSGRIESSS